MMIAAVSRIRSNRIPARDISHHGAKSKRLLIITVSLLSLTCASAQTAFSQDPTSYESIRKVWSARESNAKTARLIYSCRHVIARGSMDGRTAERNQTKLFPEQDVTADIEVQIAVDEHSISISEVGPRWDNRLERLVESHRVDLFDGEVYSTYIDVNSPDKTTLPAGFVSRVAFVRGAAHKSVAQAGAILPYIVPLTQALRPVHDRFLGGRINQWASTSQTESVGGTQCIVIKSDEGDLTQRMWLDSNNCNSLTRWQVEVKKKPLIHAEIHYQGNSFVPEEWSTVRFNPSTGDLVESHELKLKSSTLNGDIPSSEFRSSFPAGTLVTNLTRPDSKDIYLQLPGGARRQLTKEDVKRGAQHLELLARTSGANRRSLSSFIFVALSGGFGALLTCYGFLAFQKKRVKH